MPRAAPRRPRTTTNDFLSDASFTPASLPARSRLLDQLGGDRGGPGRVGRHHGIDVARGDQRGRVRRPGLVGGEHRVDGGVDVDGVAEVGEVSGARAGRAGVEGDRGASGPLTDVAATSSRVIPATETPPRVLPGSARSWKWVAYAVPAPPSTNGAATVPASATLPRVFILVGSASRDTSAPQLPSTPRDNDGARVASRAARGRVPGASWRLPRFGEPRPDVAEITDLGPGQWAPATTSPAAAPTAAGTATSRSWPRRRPRARPSACGR